MKRSGGVTAAAVVMFIGSAFWVFLLVPVTLVMIAAETSGAAGAQQFAPPLLCAGLAAWGIATGVGILKLGRWAWVSTIVMSAVAIFAGFFGTLALAFVPAMLSDSELPAASVRLVALGATTALLASMAVAIWWLVLFTRDRVRMQFALYRGPVPGAPYASQIPTSILVIATVTFAGAGFLLLSLGTIVREHLPMIVFGAFTSGWLVVTYVAALVSAQIVLPTFVLRKRTWALEGMVWYAIVIVVNDVLFLASSARSRYFDIILQGDESFPGNPQAAQQFRQTIAYASYLFGICIAVIFLYFLITRRKAYREACRPASPPPPVTPSVTSPGTQTGA
jgi:hypothetical protein